MKKISRRNFLKVSGAMAAAGALAACGGSGASTPAASGAASTSTAASTAAAGEDKFASLGDFTMTVGHAQPEGNPRFVSMEQFAADVAEATNGHVKIEVYGNGQLGTEKEMLEQVVAGTVQGMRGGQFDFSPRLLMFTLPFLTNTRAQVTALLQSDLAQKVCAEAEGDDLKKRIEELTRILASAEALDQVVTDEMDEAVAKWGSPRRTVLLDADPDGTLTPVVAQGAGASGVSKSALEAVKAATTISSAEADVAAAAAAAKKTGEQSTLTGALKIEDEPCVVMMSATGLIARTTPSAMDVFNARSTSDERLRDDQITTIFETSTRATYGLVTSAGRLVLAHVVDLPALPATATLSLKGGVQADELIGMTESTDPIRGERVITAIAMEQPTSGKTSAKDESEDGGAAEAKPLPSLAIGTRNGVIKRWNREAPTTMDSWPVIDLKDGDEVVFAAVAEDDDRLVFISSDSSLLTFEAKNVRPQGRTAGGMAGIKLAEGARVAAFNVVPAGKVAWTYEEGENGLTSGSGAVVLTVAGDSDALPGTENGAAKVTPLEMYPTKGRATGGVRSQRFLKGQNTLILAWVGLYPLHASTSAGSPVELPKPDMRRDGSGVDLASPIAFIA